MTSNDLWPLTAWKYKRFPYSINRPMGLQHFKWDHFTFSAFLTTFTSFDFWPWYVALTSWTLEGSHVTSLNLVWFQTFFFSNEIISNFQPYNLTLTDHDLDMWHLTSWTYEGSHIISKQQVWFQSYVTFQMWWILHFQPIIKLDLEWPLTLVYELWLREHTKIPILYQ